MLGVCNGSLFRLLTKWCCHLAGWWQRLVQVVHLCRTGLLQRNGQADSSFNFRV
jgi:hypothetical protein